MCELIYTKRFISFNFLSKSELIYDYIENAFKRSTLFMFVCVFNWLHVRNHGSHHHTTGVTTMIQEICSQSVELKAYFLQHHQRIWHAPFFFRRNTKEYEILILVGSVLFLFMVDCEMRKLTIKN